MQSAILGLFADRETRTWDIGGAFQFRDRVQLPVKDLLDSPEALEAAAAGKPWRVVPGGTTVRGGVYLAPGVTIMPPSYINIGAWIGEGTMIDSHVLVGSCAQVGSRVHLSAAVQIGGVLEPAGRRPVIVEDEVFVGAQSALLEGVLVKRGAVIAAGVILTGTSRLYDLVREPRPRRDAGGAAGRPSRRRRGAGRAAGPGRVRGEQRHRPLGRGRGQIPGRTHGRSRRAAGGFAVTSEDQPVQGKPVEPSAEPRAVEGRQSSLPSSRVEQEVEPAVEPEAPPIDGLLRNGLLAGLAPHTLATDFGTPLYVYDLDLVGRRIDALGAVLPFGFRLAFAVKANPALGVLTHIAGSGIGADVASGGELEAVLRAGFAPVAIAMTGPGKRDDELAAAVTACIGVVTVESLGELSRLDAIAARLRRRQPILLRLAVADDAKFERVRLIGGAAGKFGMPLPVCGKRPGSPPHRRTWSCSACTPSAPRTCSTRTGSRITWRSSWR